MTHTSIRQRGVVLLVALILVLALTLAACGGRGGAQRGGGYGLSNVTTQQTNGGTGTDLSGDQQEIDSLMNQLDSAAGDANFDYSSLDSPAQP